MAAAGDVDADGYDDILVGAAGNNDGGEDAGKTYLILGRNAGWPGTLADSDAAFLGEWAGDESGYCVAGVGDVDADGHDDLLVGARESDDGGSGAGKAYLAVFP